MFEVKFDLANPKVLAQNQTDKSKADAMVHKPR